MMNVNAKGVWLGMRAVLPGMVERRAGKICNVASTAAHIGLRDAAAYCASKGAVLALTRQAGSNTRRSMCRSIPSRPAPR